MIFDICGWIGMILVLVAYMLLSTNKINNGLLYQVLNLLSGIFMDYIQKMLGFHLHCKLFGYLWQ